MNESIAINHIREMFVDKQTLHSPKQIFLKIKRYLFLDYGVNYIFFRITKIFGFQDRKLKLSPSVWKIISWNLTKLYSFSSFRHFLFPFFLFVVWLSWPFCEVSRNSFLNRCWIFQLSILKNKKVLFLKKYYLSRSE